jgi:hypothetical protein
MTEHVAGPGLRDSTDSIERISQHASAAFEERVSRHSVGLVFKGTQGLPETASAVALRWKQRRVVVTADHVIPRGNEGDGVSLILPRDRPLSRGNDIQPLPPPDSDCVVSLPHLSLIRCEFEDLAYFEVDEKFGEGSDIEFCEIPSFAASPPIGTSCVLSGFPQDLSGRLSSEEVIVNLANRWSEVCVLGDSERFLKGFDPERHFLMKFHKADKGERPEGFSGAGVWFPLRESSASQIWHPVPGLAGIQSKWFPSSAVTLSVRAELLARFLQESLK